MPPADAGQAFAMTLDQASTPDAGTDGAHAVTTRFLAALAALEADHERLDDLAGLFADGAELRTVALPQTYTGPDGAREFWHAYRATFGVMQSTYGTQLVGPDTAVLEWQTVGEAADGRSVDYRGVSILELDGERISGFRAYFDPAALAHRAAA